MENTKVLIVDDDEHICQILQDYFEFENFKTITAQTGKLGLKMINEESPDIIILDIMLPEIDGWEIVRKIRPQNKTPIIFLSAKTEETDRITGLELGADDYVTKPFSPKEIVVRAKTILRRINQQEKEQNKNKLTFPGLIINKNHHTVKVDGENIELTPKEFAVLWTLASSTKKVFPREELLNIVWDYDYYGDIRTVDTHIKSLRKKLGNKIGEYIKTVWGVGYKFEVNKN